MASDSQNPRVEALSEQAEELEKELEEIRELLRAARSSSVARGRLQNDRYNDHVESTAERWRKERYAQHADRSIADTID